MPELVIGDHTITDYSDVFVIAEIGHNHGGSLETAIEMCRVAKECGCDAVKLQKRTLDKCYTKAFLATPYNSEHAFGRTYGEHRAVLEFGKEEYNELKRYCQGIGIEFFSTAFDEEAADFLEAVGVPAYKIASGDLTNIPLIKHVAKKGKPMIISTGGAHTVDIGRALWALGATPAAFLHCVALYPTPAHEANLSAIKEIRLKTGRIVGYSCHYNGILLAELAVVWGAQIIEKHFTLDHSAKGSDHAMSLQPEGMRRLVRDLRRAKAATGPGVKYRLAGEEKSLAKMEKALYPTRTLPAWHVIEAGDLAARSPTTPDGMRPWQIDRLAGRSLVLEASTAGPITPKVLGEEE